MPLSTGLSRGETPSPPGAGGFKNAAGSSLRLMHNRCALFASAAARATRPLNLPLSYCFLTAIILYAIILPQYEE